MKTFPLLSIFLLSLSALCFAEELNSTTKTIDDVNPRLTDLNPNAWKELSMKEIFSDLQKADGIFSSFICDEIATRLTEKSLNTLKEIEDQNIERESRINAFNVCLSPEERDPTKVLKAIAPYKKKFPQLCNEIHNATKK